MRDLLLLKRLSDLKCWRSWHLRCYDCDWPGHADTGYCCAVVSAAWSWSWPGLSRDYDDLRRLNDGGSCLLDPQDLECELKVLWPSGGRDGHCAGDERDVGLLSCLCLLCFGWQGLAALKSRSMRKLDSVHWLCCLRFGAIGLASADCDYDDGGLQRVRCATCADHFAFGLQAHLIKTSSSDGARWCSSWCTSGWQRLRYRRCSFASIQVSSWLIPLHLKKSEIMVINYLLDFETASCTFNFIHPLWNFLITFTYFAISFVHVH